MITTRLVGHATPLGHVRPVPFEHAPVIKVQYNNDNNWQSFLFYYCILHKWQLYDVTLHKVAAHCQSPITLPAVGNGSLSIRPPAHHWRHQSRSSTSHRVTKQTGMCFMKKCGHVWLDECQHVWVSVDIWCVSEINYVAIMTMLQLWLWGTLGVCSHPFRGIFERF